MNILILCTGSVWQPVISAMPCICWGVMVLIALYMVLRYVASPLIANCHERKMKEATHKREKEWAEFKTTKASTDDALKKQVKELKEQVEELEKAKKAEEYNKGLLEKQLKMYRGIFDELNVEVKLKEKK